MSARPVKRVPGQGRVTPRGATRQEPGPGLSAATKAWLLRGMWLALVMVLLGAGYYGLSAPLKEWLDRPVANVSVEGSFRYLGRERVEQLLGRELAEDFFKLDLARVKRVLEQDPWVERASLRRQWPDRLEVRIVEQEPIARWGDSGFLNRRGDVIALDDTSALQHLPRLEGAEKDATRVMERYQDLAQLLRSRGLSIQSLRSDRGGAWTMELEDGVVIVIGRDRVLDKVQRFTSVLDRELAERWQEVKRVDLRYQSGVAVSWQTEQDSE